MKYILIPILLLATNFAKGQITEKQLKLNCYPPNGTRIILDKPDMKAIHPAWKQSYEGGSQIGLGWSFISKRIISTKNGKFLFGDIYTSRGGKFNVSQNGFNGSVYVPYEQWECSK
jgi:hypothetical protein